MLIMLSDAKSLVFERHRNNLIALLNEDIPCIRRGCNNTPVILLDECI